MRVTQSKDRELSAQVKPAIAVSIADGVASVTLEPDTAELSADMKAAILAAGRVRVFIDARGDAPSNAMARPVRAADYPSETLALLIRRATLVGVMVPDCTKPDTAADIEAGLKTFDQEAENSPWVVRVVTDSPWEWGELIQRNRPWGTYCLASPIYEAEPAE